MNQLGHKSNYLPLKADHKEMIATLRVRLLVGLLIVGAVLALMAPASVMSLVEGVSRAIQSAGDPSVITTGAAVAGSGKTNSPKMGSGM